MLRRCGRGGLPWIMTWLISFFSFLLSIAFLLIFYCLGLFPWSGCLQTTVCSAILPHGEVVVIKRMGQMAHDKSCRVILCFWRFGLIEQVGIILVFMNWLELIRSMCLRRWENNHFLIGMNRLETLNGWSRSFTCLISVLAIGIVVVRVNKFINQFCFF